MQLVPFGSGSEVTWDSLGNSDVLLDLTLSAIRQEVPETRLKFNDLDMNDERMRTSAFFAPGHGDDFIGSLFNAFLNLITAAINSEQTHKSVTSVCVEIAIHEDDVRSVTVCWTFGAQ